MEGKYVILCFDILPLYHLRLEESSAVSESEPEVQKQKAALREAYNYKKKIFSAAAIEKPIPKTPGKLNLQRMTVLKRYVLRLFMSLKYVTANVVDRNNGRIVATASTVEHAIKGTLECGRSCNAKAAAVVGEVLAMRLKVEGLEQGQGRGIHVDVKKEIEKKGFKNHTKVWAIVNALKNNGVKLIVDENDDDTSQPSHW